MRALPSVGWEGVATIQHIVFGIVSYHPARKILLLLSVRFIVIILGCFSFSPYVIFFRSLLFFIPPIVAANQQLAKRFLY